MAGTNVVNLDALIPREDFYIDEKPVPINTVEKISLSHLEGGFLGPVLRKPDFQRETVQWNPAKVVDLVRAFVDADLIPAVILWRAGQYVFVIDGAHRLSALLAWVHDDYGDRERSLKYFGGHITEDQRKVAEKTRKLIAKEVGAYQQYMAYRTTPSTAPQEMRTRLTNISINTMIAQWVPTGDAKTAEDSFFKINQAATPIDPTERRILKARRSASAIASRAITHAGTGHKYWNNFGSDIQKAIEERGGSIYQSLYAPPIDGSPITTLDVPVAGHGYSALPFVFDLVNDTNQVAVADTSEKKNVKDELPQDLTGDQTMAYLDAVAKRLRRITGDDPASLGLHPVVYFYTRGGVFQPLAFIAVARFLDGLLKTDKLKAFTKVRAAFEDFLIEHKEGMSLLIHKFGTGSRSLPWLQQYYERIYAGMLAGKDAATIQTEFGNDPQFTFLTASKAGAVRPVLTEGKRKFSGTTKTASYFATALPGCVRCALCGARIHKNSMNFDHKKKAAEKGDASVGNARVTHPYCNSIRD